MYRIGLGYDIHTLREGRDLIIGGVKITHEKGLMGHSDADVLIHAIIDALLGALALSDIGTLFPDTDNKYKDADSTILLKHVYGKILEKGYKIVNIDSNIIAQEPKMMPYIPKMRETLDKILNIGQENISIKAKTNEKMVAVDKSLQLKRMLLFYWKVMREEYEKIISFINEFYNIKRNGICGRIHGRSEKGILRQFSCRNVLDNGAKSFNQ